MSWPDFHPADGASFPPTRKSVLQLAQTGDAAAKEYLKEYLYSSYVGPMLAHAQRCGVAEHDAQAYAHDFLTGIIQETSAIAWDPAKGKFRSYLLGAFNHFLSLRRRLSQKRGGGVEHVALDEQLRDVSSEDELRFDYDWAQELFTRAIQRLKSNYVNNQRRFELLKSCLANDDYSCSSLASGLGMSVGQVYVEVSRLRRRFRDCLRAEIAESFLRTDFTETDISDEMHYLRRVLRAGTAPR